jgi:hypothetical protein
MLLIPAAELTYKSKNSFHKIENKSPWSPLHKIRVGSPRPKSPKIPSSRITNLAASAMHRQLHPREEKGQENYYVALTIRDLGVIDLTIGLDDSQRVGD